MLKTMKRMIKASVRGLTARTLGMIGMGAVLAATSLASAAAAAPQPQLQRAASPLIGFALIFFMLVVVVSISLMPSKRGHQD